MKNIFFSLFCVCVIFTLKAQNYNSNTNQNQIIINNQPVQEKIIVKEVPKYIEKKEYIYVQPPKPKKLEPILLLESLWVYPEDLGSHTMISAEEILWRLNKNKMFGHSDWRLPTYAELKLMYEYNIVSTWRDFSHLYENANISSKSSYTLRPVAGLSFGSEEEMAYAKKQEEKRRLEEIRKRLEREAYQNRLKLENSLIENNKIKKVEGVCWSLYNEGSTVEDGEGIEYVEPPFCQTGYRLPEVNELKSFIKGAKLQKKISPNGYIITIYSKGGVSIVGGTYFLNDGSKYNTEGQRISEKAMARMIFDINCIK